MRKTTPTLDEIRSWGATTDVATAGTAYGLSRTTSYDRVRAGEFPVRVIRIGRALRVPVAEIVQSLSPSQDQAASDVA